MGKITRNFAFLLVLTLTLLLSAGTVYAQTALKQDMSGDDVLKLQQKLHDLGYYQGSLDGVFGPGTRYAVVSFQADYNLDTDGIAGPATLQALQSSISRGGGSSSVSALKEGMSGDNVLKLQKKLRELGYYQGSLDGTFGPGTRIAVVDFQTDSGLTVDGIAGSETLQAMKSYRPGSIQTNRGQTDDRKAQTVASFAKQYLGVPYVWAGSSPSGFDCSGFACYVFSQFGVNLPHAADGQFNCGVQVSQLQPGDMVFFSTYEPGPSHVGIYIGNNQFIHASSGAGQVTITSLSEAFYSERYLGARRVL